MMIVAARQTDNCRYCADRERQVDELREKVRQLHDLAFGQGRRLPAAWPLSKTEALVLRLLLSRDIVNWPVFEAAITAEKWDYDAEPKILGVYICRLRRKLEPFGVRIDTHWGVGWSLPPAMKDAINHAAETGGEVVGAPVVRKAVCDLQGEILRFITERPSGVHVSEIARAFREHRGLGMALLRLARNGEVSRTLAGRSKCTGYIYFPHSGGARG